MISALDKLPCSHFQLEAQFQEQLAGSIMLKQRLHLLLKNFCGPRQQTSIVDSKDYRLYIVLTSNNGKVNEMHGKVIKVMLTPVFGQEQYRGMWRVFGGMLLYFYPLILSQMSM